MIVKKVIAYAGVDNPQNAAEMKVEILGLKNAIKIAEELITRYEQVFAITELTREGKLDGSQIAGTGEDKAS